MRPPLLTDSLAEAVFTLLRVQYTTLYQKPYYFTGPDEVYALIKAAKIKLGKGLKKLLAQHGVFVSAKSEEAGGGIKELNGAKFKKW